MPRINLLSPITPSASAAEANEGAMEIINGYVDKLSGYPVIKTRPGLELVDTLPNAKRVDLYWWEAQKKLIIVCGAKVYYKRTFTATPVDITPVLSTDKIAYNVKVLFSADEYGVTMSTGTHMIWWDGSSANCIRITDANAPSEITGLTYLKGYTIASEVNTQKFYWATYGATDSRSAPPPWSAIQLSASSAPDNIVSMSSGWEELYLLGRESVESQYVTGDATVPFKSLQGSVGEVGCVNNQVLVKMLNTWLFLTPNRQVVVMQGRVPKVVSQSVEGIFRDMSSFEDVEAFSLFERFYVLTFRSENTTLVYDTQYQLWYRWEVWNSSAHLYDRFLGVTSASAKAWGRYMVGSHNGKLLVADYKYLTDDETAIRGQITSAHIDHNTFERKFVNEVKLRLRRGY